MLTTCTLISCNKAPNIQAVDSYRITEQAVIDADMSDDAEMVAILSQDQNVSVWHNNQKNKLFEWSSEELGEEELLLLSLSADKKWLAVASYWNVTLLNLTNGEVIGSWYFQDNQANATVSTLNIGPNGRKAVAGLTNGAILKVDFKSGYATKYQHHDKRVSRLVMADDSLHAISGALDKKFVYWRLDNNEILFQKQFRSRITASIYDNESKKLFVSDALQSHLIIDMSNGEQLTALNFFENFRFFRQGHFLQRGRYLVTTSPKSEVTLWNAHTGDEVATWNIKRFTSEATTLDLAVNLNGELVTLSSDGVIQTWDYKQIAY